MRLSSIIGVALLIPSSALAQNLTLTGVCPGNLDFGVSGITANANYALLTANAQGTAMVPGGPCAGTVVDLDAGSLALRTIRGANQAGADNFSLNLPAGACGSVVQVVDLATCLVSNFDFLPLPAVASTITDVQGGVHAQYDVVIVEGVVTATSTDGLWLQEAGSAAAGSGVFVYLAADWPLDWGLVARGDVAQVTGEYIEFFDLTEVNVDDSPSGQVALVGQTSVPVVAQLTLGDLAANAEPWEGVLVEVNNVVVSALPNAFGEWEVSDGVNTILVDDNMFLPGNLAVGQTLSSLTGPLHYSFGAFRILPRDANDIQ